MILALSTSFQRFLNTPLIQTSALPKEAILDEITEGMTNKHPLPFSQLEIELKKPVLIVNLDRLFSNESEGIGGSSQGAANSINYRTDGVSDSINHVSESAADITDRITQCVRD